MRGLAVLCLLAAAGWLYGCAGLTADLPVFVGGNPIAPDEPGYATDLQIRYLAAGGVMLKRGPDVVLTGPFFSNPSVLRVMFGEVRTRPEQVDRFLQPLATQLVVAKAVLVGHAHYDHLMDVPYVKEKYLPSAKIYGSQTLKNVLAAARGVNGDDVIAVEDGAGTATQPGTWHYVARRVRFMALKSQHAPVLLHVKFAEGSYTSPLQELPVRAGDWREGQTLAYLIDFLGTDEKTVDFRVHYQDAASTPPLGFPPSAGSPDERRADVAIVCMPGFDQVEDYPEKIVDKLRPRFVVGIHWEDFFAELPADRADLRTVASLDAKGFIARVKTVLPPDATFTMPAPGAWMRFSPAPAN